jgi:hypothetical protein
VDGPAWRYEGSADGMARHVADAIVKHCLPQDLCWMDVTFLSTSTSVYLQPLKKEVPPDLCAVSDCARCLRRKAHGVEHGKNNLNSPRAYSYWSAIVSCPGFRSRGNLSVASYLAAHMLATTAVARHKQDDPLVFELNCFLTYQYPI